MNKQEAENYIYESYLRAQKYQAYDAPDWQKRRPDLTYDYIRSFATAPCVVVTGSKGKGSVANMISQLLKPTYKVGLLTSPHIFDFCERFIVDGVNISDADFISCLEAVKPKLDAIAEKLPADVCISPIGVQAALALTYFQRCHTEFNVFECGKGAKTDDVNNIKHRYAVINSIFLEHTRELGKTLEAIATNKSFVINGEQKCVYVGAQPACVLAVIKNRAKLYKTELKIYGEDFRAENVEYTRQGMRFDVLTPKHSYKNLLLPLLGDHQARNCALALSLCEDVLNGMLDFATVQTQLANIIWPGRMEIISEEPFVLLDACINRASTQMVKNTLKALHIDSVTTIIGIPDDKDFAGVAVAMQSLSEHIILTRSDNPHYVFTPKQKEILAAQGIQTETCDSAAQAITLAKSYGKPIVILGTMSVVAAVENLKYLHKRHNYSAFYGACEPEAL